VPDGRGLTRHNDREGIQLSDAPLLFLFVHVPKVRFTVQNFFHQREHPIVSGDSPFASQSLHDGPSFFNDDSPFSVIRIRRIVL
jgi:hypothetical protein